MKQIDFISRRSIIQKILILSAATMAGTACDINALLTIEEIGHESIKLLRLPFLAAIIGRLFLEKNAQFGSLPPEQLITQIFQGTSINPGKTNRASLVNMDEELRNKVRKDFENERIEKIDGWLFSRTEAQLCALLVLMS